MSSISTKIFKFLILRCIEQNGYFLFSHRCLAWSSYRLARIIPHKCALVRNYYSLFFRVCQTGTPSGIQGCPGSECNASFAQTLCPMAHITTSARCYANLIRQGTFLDFGGRPPLRFLRLACNCLKYAEPRLAIFLPPFLPRATAAGSFFFAKTKYPLRFARVLCTELNTPNGRMLLIGRSRPDLSIGKHIEVFLAGAIGHKGPAPSQPAQDQNGGCEEFRGSQAYPPSTACGQPEACSRGRLRRCIEGFRGGRDSQRLAVGSVGSARCDPHGA